KLVKLDSTPREVQGTFRIPLMQKSVFIIEPIEDDDELVEGLDSHWGEEIIYVVKNSVWVWFADVPDKEQMRSKMSKDERIVKILLHEGDCLHYSSELLHGFKAYREPATALFVYSDAGAPPQFRQA